MIASVPDEEQPFMQIASSEDLFNLSLCFLDAMSHFVLLDSRHTSSCLLGVWVLTVIVLLVLLTLNPYLPSLSPEASSLPLRGPAACVAWLA